MPLCWRPRSLATSAVLTFGGLVFAACSDAGPVSAGDGGVETIRATVDAGRYEAAPELDAKVPWNRMSPHEKRILSAMRLQVVYIGFEGDDGAPNFDPFIDWLVTSNYWSILEQYGVGAASRVGSVRVPRSALIPSAMVRNGLITAEDLERVVFAAIHGAPLVDDAGSDAGGDASGDAARDAGDVTDAALGLVPNADAYVFFLPGGVNVSLGARGGHVDQTCVDAGGYHSYDGVEPYAIIPPCTIGRSPLAVSHELTEMATDPIPGTGWFSDADAANAGGELGDLCNQPAAHGGDGWEVTQLWSNADGDCEPN